MTTTPGTFSPSAGDGPLGGGGAGGSGKGGRGSNRPSFAGDRPSLDALFGKPPPHAIEAEMALLGAMILDPRVTGDVIMLVKSPEFFYLESHQRIFQALITLYDRHQSGDLVQLVDALRDDESLKQLGGTRYLEKLAGETPGPAGAVHWARIVADKAKLRSLITTASDIVYSAYTLGQGSDENATEIIDKAEQQIFEIARKHELFEPQGLAELIQEEYDRLEAQWGKGVSGIPTYFRDLDKYLGGLQPGEMIIVAARPSMGKCLAHDAELVLRDGSIATMSEIFARKSGEIPTLSDSLKLDWAEPSDFIDDGVKPVFEVVTQTGRRVETTLTHPFLTLRGWVPLSELRPGDHIAVPRVLPVFGMEIMRECEVKLLAYLIGDGGLTGATPRFTNSNPRVVADFIGAVGEFGGLRVRPSEKRDDKVPSWRIAADGDAIHANRAAFSANLSARIAVLRIEPESLAPGGIRGAKRHAPNGLAAWLAQLGLMGCRAQTKSIPRPVFTLARPLLALFLNRLFATDGWATVLSSGRAQIGYASVNERLARQVQHLLLRFGVVSSLKTRWVKYRESRRPSWQVDITDAKAIRTFASEIGIFGKEQKLERVLRALEGRKYQTNRDLFPMAVWDLLEEAKGSMSWAELARRAGFTNANLRVRKRALSRERLARFASVLTDARLKALAESDVLWDGIRSITYAGDRQVYDLTIPRTHNFVAADVCVHNTALSLNLVEQIALGGGPFSHAGGPRVPVGFFSLEMSKSAIVQRLLSARSGVDLHTLRTLGEISNRAMFEDVIRRLQDAGGALHDAPIYVDDMAGLTVMGLRARARRMVQQYGVKAIFIDYLQLMTAPAFARESRQVEVSAISRGIKALARELNLPVVCLSQLNRGPESRTDNRPRMSDLRESGSIEQDADVVILLHREEYYHVNDPSWANDPDNADKVGVAELIIAKQRNGPTGVVELKWDASTTRFKDLHRMGGGYADYAVGDAGGAVGGGYAAPEPKPAYGAPSPGSGGYADPVGGYSADPPPVPKAVFAPGKKSGPVADFRDGGGPDRSDPPFDVPEDEDEVGGLPI